MIDRLHVALQRWRKMNFFRRCGNELCRFKFVLRTVNEAARLHELGGFVIRNTTNVLLADASNALHGLRLLDDGKHRLLVAVFEREREAMASFKLP
jgi:hypothetical protein